MEFDYVIAGGGSAGCVLANRLSADPKISVCLVEAGGGGKDVLIRAPAGAAGMISGRPKVNNWAFQTVPQAGLNERRGFQPRGRALGGSSAINAMLYVRGHPSDYDDWADLGADGWDWGSCAPWFHASERNARGAGDDHGAEGPLQVADQNAPRPVTGAFLEAARQMQWPATDDFNADQEGVGLYQVTQFFDGPQKGERCSAAAAYLHPVMDRPNLTVMTGTLADRISFDGTRATGLHVRKGRRALHLKARREVISSLGAFGTPALLQRSGIGPGDLLASLGIEVVAHSPLVGENLQDHLDLILAYRSKRRDTFALNPLGGLAFARGALEWRKSGTGMITTPYAEGGAFLKTDPSLPRPDIQFHFVPAIVDQHNRKLHLSFGYSCHICVLRPASRGSVRIGSTDPAKAPMIDPAFLSDPADIPVMIKGARMMDTMLKTNAFAPWRGKRLYPHDGSDAAWEQDIRNRADTIYHPVGTCHMGGGDAPCDPAGRVRGTQSLRVVDASLMPRLIGGNTNAPVIMMAERLAQTVLNAPGQPAPSGPPPG